MKESSKASKNPNQFHMKTKFFAVPPRLLHNFVPVFFFILNNKPGGTALIIYTFFRIFPFPFLR